MDARSVRRWTTWFADGGASSCFVHVFGRVESRTWMRIVISHADADHYNAIAELFQLFSVGEVYVSPVMFERPIPAVQ